MNVDCKLISIIVPVYKVESYLPKCINSIINQTYQNLEIILIDDGSPDACGSVCEEYAKKDNRIKVFHKENGGLSDARNYGIDRASGDYFAFVDSDDWIEPDMLEVLVDVAERNIADIVTFAVYMEYPGRTVAEHRYNRTFENSIDAVKALITGGIRNGVWSKLYRKACFTTIRFPYGHVFEEYATVYKLLLNAVTVVSISEPFYHYRQKREDAITQTQSMPNLYDYWLVHKSRYDFFVQDDRFNTDEKIMEKLEEFCAGAIARAWRWCYANSAQERKQYCSLFAEMQAFSASHFPCFGKKGWPLFLRFSVFMARFNNVFVFALMYYLNLSYRRVRG